MILFWTHSAQAAITVTAITGATDADLVAGTADADYDFNFQTDVTDPASEHITIIFPADYAIAGSATVQDAAATPNAGAISIDGVPNKPVTVTTSGQEVRLQLGTPQELQNLAIQFRILTGVTNPTAAVTTGQFQIEIGTTASGTDVDSNATAGTVTITHAATDHLVTVAPAGPQVAGGSFNLTSITAVDRFGNVADGAGAEAAYAGTKTLAYTLSGTMNGPTSGTDTFTTSVDFTAGAATTTLATTLHRAQSTTISADDTALTKTVANVASASFNVNAAAASEATSTIVASPTSIAANGTSTSTVTVQAIDAFGNNLTAGGATVALSTTSGSLGAVTDNNNGTYTATLTSSTSAGTATITGTLNAATITDNATVSFTVGAASKLAMETQPGGAEAAQAFTPQPVVLVQDAAGNTVTSDSSTQVTVAIGTNPNGGTLSGTTTVTAVNGVVTFSGSSINAAGNGYTLTFSTTGLTGVTSNAFNITAPAASSPRPPPPTTVNDPTGVTVVVEDEVEVTISAGVPAAVTTMAPDGSTATVTAPAGALPAGSTLKAAAISNVQDLAAQAPPPANTQLMVGFSIQAQDASGQPLTDSFAQPVTLEFSVPASTMPAEASSGQLVLAFWNGSEWSEVNATFTTNADGSISVTASVDHFTLFGVLHQPDRGQLLPPPAPSGVTLTIWGGGGYDVLDAALGSGNSAWVTVQGPLVGYVAGAPAFVNAEFLSLHPERVPAGTVVLVALQ